MCGLVWRSAQLLLLQSTLSSPDKIAHSRGKKRRKKIVHLFKKLPKGIRGRVRWAEGSEFIYSLQNRHSPRIMSGCKQSCEWAILTNKAGFGYRDSSIFWKVPFSNTDIKTGFSKLKFEASAFENRSTYFALGEKSASQSVKKTNLADQKGWTNTWR